MKLKVIILFAFLTLSVSAQKYSCGVSGVLTGFVVNGTLSDRGKWPWIVSLHKIKDDAYFCGGTLVGSKIVLTAAHCIQKKKIPPANPPKKKTAADIVVKLGKYDLKEQNERGSAIKYLTDVIIHPKWKYFEPKFDADIAILIFESDVELSVSIFPICLWEGGGGPTEARGMAVGWGKSERGEAYETKPREIELNVLRNDDCFLKAEQLTKIASENTFCATRPDNAGVCTGDSGSGLVMRRDQRVWFLKGIVSSGVINYNTCDLSEGSLFTDVLKYQDWIAQVARDSNAELPKTNREPTIEAKPKNFDKEIFCFFESWAEGRSGDGFFSLNYLKPELCTHLVFLHAETDKDSDTLKSIHREHENGQQLYKAFNDLKKFYRLKTLLAVGSYNEGSVKYSQLSADPEKRRRFAENAAEFLKEHDFDGMHLHWEQPGERGGAREDKENLVLLLADISKVFKQRDLMLTVMVRTQTAVVEKSYDLPNIAKHVDRVMMFTFDMAAYWNNKIGYPSALKGAGDDTIDSRVNFFISQGVPAEKIVLGVPFFGRTFVALNDGNIGDPSVAGFPGPYFEEPGFMGFNEQCSMRKSKNWTFSYDVTSSQAIGIFKEGGASNVVVFDSPRSLVNKAKFVADKELAGFWTWFVDSDDFRAQCDIDTTAFDDFPNVKVAARKEKDYQLLRTINEAMEAFSVPKLPPSGFQKQYRGGFPATSTHASTSNNAGASVPGGFSVATSFSFDLRDKLVLGVRNKTTFPA